MIPGVKKIVADLEQGVKDFETKLQGMFHNCGQFFSVTFINLAEDCCFFFLFFFVFDGYIVGYKVRIKNQIRHF